MYAKDLEEKTFFRLTWDDIADIMEEEGLTIDDLEVESEEELLKLFKGTFNIDDWAEWVIEFLEVRTKENK